MKQWYAQNEEEIRKEKQRERRESIMKLQKKASQLAKLEMDNAMSRRSQSVAPAMYNEESEFDQSQAELIQRELSSATIDKISLGRLDKHEQIRSKSVLGGLDMEGSVTDSQHLSRLDDADQLVKKANKLPPLQNTLNKKSSQSQLGKRENGGKLRSRL